jgi:hypothetical protein
MSEFFRSFFTAILFLIILESCGSLFLKFINFIVRKFAHFIPEYSENLYSLTLNATTQTTKHKSQSTEKELAEYKELHNPSLILKTITGMLVLGMIYFFIGIFNFFNKEILLWTALIFPILNFGLFLYSTVYRNFKNDFITKKIISKKIILNIFNIFLSKVKQQKYLISGLGLFSILSFPAAFRPIIQFDAIWYHLTIPKLFLESGNINYNGEFLRYSVHPYLNFFWNSFFLSTPQNILTQGIAINIFQWILIILSIYFALNTINKISKIPNWLLFLSPSLLGIVNNITNAYGAGYNDLYGMAITLFLIPFLYQIGQQKNISFIQIIWVLLCIITLSLLKIFFALYGFIAFMYLVWLLLDKQNSQLENNKLPSLNKNENEKYTVSELLKNVFLSVKVFLKNTIFQLKTYANNSVKAFKTNRKFWLVFILTTVFFGITFILPWIVRSYLQTGRILDPIGAPGINEDAYNFAGSKSALNHWLYFVWLRLAKNLILIPTIRYTPLLGLAFVLPIFKQFRIKKYLALWSLGMVGFWAIYFFSIVSEWRYFITGVYTLLLVLIIFTAENISRWSNILYGKLKLVVIFACCVLITLSYGITLKTTDLKTDMFIFQNQSYNEYLRNRIGLWQYGYYKSQGSFQPTKLTTTETILVLNLQGMAYVSNPILSPRTQPELFQNLNNLNELIEILNDNQISYVLMKNEDISQLCKHTFVKNCSLEEVNNRFKLEGKIEEERVWWYSLR